MVNEGAKNSVNYTDKNLCLHSTSISVYTSISVCLSIPNPGKNSKIFHPSYRCKTCITFGRNHYELFLMWGYITNDTPLWVRTNQYYLRFSRWISYETAGSELSLSAC